MVVSAVSERMFDSWDGTREKKKLDGHPELSKNKTPECVVVESPVGR